MLKFTSLALIALLASGCATHRSESEDRAFELRRVSTTAVAGRNRPNFATIKYGDLGNKHLLPLLGDDPSEWYCDCKFDPATKDIDFESCGFKPSKPDDLRRGKKIEWEHVVPRSWAAAALGCTSVKACESDQDFNVIVTDPYALVPASGALNGVRSNHVLWEVEGETRPYGECDFEIGEDENGKTYIEPPDHLKGDLARITLYMIQRYGLKVPAYGAERLYEQWSEDDPVDDGELSRVRAIRAAVADWNYPYDH